MDSAKNSDVDGEFTDVEQPTVEKVPAFENDAPTRRIGASTKPERAIRRTKRLRKKANKSYHPALKYGSLGLLVTQLVGLVLLLRYSRTHSEGTDLYLSSTAVFSMELMKFVTCNLVVFSQVGMNPGTFMRELHTHIWNSPDQMLKMSVPSFLYVVQNNLLYLALTNLDAATYQVCYQLKILTTALFSVIMLQRKFSRQKWLSLVFLTIGVAIVQTAGNPHTDATTTTTTETSNDQQSRFLGLIAILCAACTSGFSGVYFEKMLKGSTTSLWMRNIQMGLPSVIIAYVAAYVEDGAIIAEKGFFVGYSPVVWTVVVVQAIGGLIVAVVIKYADNVLKTFAASASIVISCAVSAVFLNFRPNLEFMGGASLVVISTVMYSQPDKIPRRRLKKKAILPVTNKIVGSSRVAA